MRSLLFVAAIAILLAPFTTVAEDGIDVSDQVKAFKVVMKGKDEAAKLEAISKLAETKHKDIAAALSIPLGTVMSRLHRGRKMLQGSLLDFARRKGILKRPASVPTDEDVLP